MHASTARRVALSAKKLALRCAALPPHHFAPVALLALLSLLVLCVSSTALVAQSTAMESSGVAISANASARAVAMASRAAQPPAIDGRDDDAVWSASAPIDAFRQFDPVEDAEPSMRT